MPFSLQRLTAKHADEKETERLLKETEAVILERVGEFFYGYDDTSLVKELSIACKEKGITSYDPSAIQKTALR